MTVAKIAITLDKDILIQVDRLVKEGKYKNRSKAIQDALKDKLRDWRRKRLIEEVSKLDPEEERAFAEGFLRAKDGVCGEY